MNSITSHHFEVSRTRTAVPTHQQGAKRALPWVGRPIEEADRPYSIARPEFELELAA